MTGRVRLVAIGLGEIVVPDRSWIREAIAELRDRYGSGIIITIDNVS